MSTNPTTYVATRVRALSPGAHVPLAVGAAAVLVGEAAGVDREARTTWPLLAAAIAAGSLTCAWRSRAELRLPVVLALSAVFQALWAAIHLAHGFHGDLDPRIVYGPEGRSVLHGSFPRSPYPAGAVALFAVEAWVGHGTASAANAFLMIPFELGAVAAIWSLRTRWSARLAACVALWPLDLFFWEFRFDLVPAAGLAAGIALAHRGRWHAAGWALGLGAIAKWTPGLSAVVLLLWLVCAGRRRAALSHLSGVLLPVALVNVPLFLLASRSVLAPYRAQGVRGMTGESLPYLVFRAFGVAAPPHHYYGAAAAPQWANVSAAMTQVILVGLLGLAAVWARRPSTALALAALTPALFLVANRIFSPQYFVVIVVACALAAALVVRSVRELVAVAALLAVATTANSVLFPGLAGSTSGWALVSAAALLPASAAVAFLAVRAVRP